MDRRRLDRRFGALPTEIATARPPFETDTRVPAFAAFVTRRFTPASFFARPSRRPVLVERISYIDEVLRLVRRELRRFFVLYAMGKLLRGAQPGGSPSIVHGP